MVFDERWFKQNQWWLLPYVSHDRDNLFIETNKPLVAIAPDHVSWLEEPGLITTEFHVHHVYGRRLYQRLSPLWNLMHRIDMSTWGRATGLNFGFDTLTAYPDKHVETNTVDGFVRYTETNSPYDWAWATGHDAATGTTSDDTTTGSQGNIEYVASSTADKWSALRRWIMLFKTDAIGASSVVSNAALSLYFGNHINNFTDASPLHYCSSAPASNTALATGDWDCLGTTSFGSIAYAGVTNGQYCATTLNASGQSAISKDGITKLGARIGTDIEDNPTWKSSAYTYYYFYSAQGSTTYDPKLVVTYSAASTFIPKCVFL